MSMQRTLARHYAIKAVTDYLENTNTSLTKAQGLADYLKQCLVLYINQSAEPTTKELNDNGN